MEGKHYIKLESQKALSTEEKKYRRISTYIATTTSEIKHALYERRKSIQGQEDFHPELILGRSEILDYDDIVNIEDHLKSKTGPWNLCFSTSLDGHSLAHLYDKMDGLEGPVLLIVKDITKRVFGALISDSIRISEDYYGSADCFLFTTQPKFQIYDSTKESLYFIKGNPDNLVIGSDDCGKHEKCALWISGNMKEGYTNSSATFGNPPLVIDNNGKFSIKSVECWYFSYLDDSTTL